MQCRFPIDDVLLLYFENSSDDENWTVLCCLYGTI